jgi:hypothetical protein
VDVLFDGGPVGLRLRLLTLALLLQAGPSWAELLQISGFETNNAITTEWDSVVTGTPAFQTTTVHSGTYALQCNVSASQCALARQVEANITTGTLYTRLYFRFATRPNAVADLWRFRSGTNVAGVRVQYNNATNVLRIRSEPAASQQDFATSISADQWYRIECETVLSDTVGSFSCRLYDDPDSTTITETQTISSIDTLPTNVGSMVVGIDAVNSTTNVFLDDMFWGTAAAGVVTTWPGPGKTALLKPTAEGATINYTPLSGTDNALMVDEVPGAADDATSYNTSTTAGHIDRLVLSNMPAEVTSDATLKRVQVLGRIGGDATTGSPTMRFKLWDEASSVTNGFTNNEVDINGWQVTPPAETLVYDASAKTKANLDSFEAGYELLTDTAVNQRVSALWVNVEWIETPAGAACASFKALLGAGCK